MGYDLKKCLSGYPRGIFSGDGRTRTAVQTPYQVAFYTFIRPLVFVPGMPAGGLTRAYPLELGGV